MDEKYEKQNIPDRIPLEQRNAIQSFLMEKFGVKHHSTTQLDLDWVNKYGIEVSKIIDNRDNDSIRKLVMLITDESVIDSYENEKKVNAALEILMAFKQDHFDEESVQKVLKDLVEYKNINEQK